MIDFDDPDVELRIEFDERPDQPLPKARHGELFSTAKWPFREVLTLRPLSGARRSVAATTLDVPVDARLRSSVSVQELNTTQKKRSKK